MSESFHRIGIFGLGLIGGSFALALRESGFKGSITGVDLPDVLSLARARGMIDVAATAAEAATTCDLLYLALPVDAILKTLEQIGPLAPAGTLITDTGSTKQQIVEAASRHMQRASFLGGHPLTGKEQSGLQAADASLFHNCKYVLIKSAKIPVEKRKRFQALLESFSIHVIELTAEEHDAALALTSHLPQLLSTAYAAALHSRNNETLQTTFGPGLLDMTRLALSQDTLWESILKTNKEQVMQALDVFTDQLLQLRHAVEADGIEPIFSAGREFATSVRRRLPG